MTCVSAKYGGKTPCGGDSGGGGEGGETVVCSVLPSLETLEYTDDLFVFAATGALSGSLTPTATEAVGY